MKTVLAVCPTDRDKRELQLLSMQSQYTILFHNYDAYELERIIVNNVGWLSDTFDPARVIDTVVSDYAHRIDGIISTEDYPGSIFASIIAEKMGLVGPSPHAVLCCQHKYYARLMQQKVVPEATPQFELISLKQFDDKKFSLSFPVFIKPVKSFFSVCAYPVYARNELPQYVSLSRLPDLFLEQFNWFLKRYSSFELDSQYLIAEELLEGVQSTLEGYIYNGQFSVSCIVDSIMFPNKISFKRFEYPSSLPQCVQDRMIDIAQRFVQAIHFDNGFFNIEFMYNPQTDRLHIIEVNPRLAGQFSDLVEKVDGTNTYELLLAIATGQKPVLHKKKGLHNMSICFVLRTLQDKKVISAPSKKDIDCFYQEFPDARLQFFVTAGQKLSHAFQDGKSYRYGLIHLGGRDKQDLLDKFERAQQLLPFTFASI